MIYASLFLFDAINVGLFLCIYFSSYWICCSSDENSVEDDKDGGIGVGDAPVALECAVRCAAAEEDEPSIDLQVFVQELLREHLVMKFS